MAGSVKCPYCWNMTSRAQDGRMRKTRDHIYPTSRFIVDPPELNIAITCRQCNEDKNNKSIDEWLVVLQASGDRRAKHVAAWWSEWKRQNGFVKVTEYS